MSDLNTLEMYDDTKVLVADDSETIDFSELEETIANKDDIISNYVLADPNTNIFSPQIEIFAPCSAHVDASRTNMSAKQLLQIVTSKNTDIPFIINKNYRTMTDVNSPFVMYAPHDGMIVFSKYDFLIVYYPSTETMMPYYVPEFKKLVSNTISKRYQVGLTDDKKSVKAGEMLFDYTGQITGSHMPKIGYRAKVLMTQFYGFTADDGFVMSQSFANKTRIEYGRKIFLPISKELIYYKNDKGKYFYHTGDKTPKHINNYIKVDSSESFLREIANTTEKQSKLYGKKVDSEPGGKVLKIKVHKLNKSKSFDDLETEYIYTRGLIEEVVEIYNEHVVIKKELFKTLANILPHDQAIEFTNKMFDQYESTTKLPADTMLDMSRDFNITPESIDIVLEIEVLSSNNTTRGDKFANLFAGKGVCSLILPDHLMPGGADIIFNPLGSFGRNNWGTMFELGLSGIIRDIEDKCIKNKRAEVTKRLRFVADYYVNLYDVVYAERMNELADDIDSNDNVWNAFKADQVKHNGLYLYVDNFPGITFKDFINSFIFKYEKEFNVNLTKKQEITYSKELMKYMREKGFISSVFGKDHFEEVTQMAYMGEAYWIKLYHTSNSKFNALGMSKYYSTQTGDPNRGAKNSGGQKMSWQSSAALLGHDAKNPIIKEYYGVKSSAVEDKNNYISKMVKEGEYTMKKTYYSPTTSTLNCYLAMSFMRFHGYDPIFIDQTVQELLNGEKELTEEDITFMEEDIEAIDADMKENPDKYQDEVEVDSDSIISDEDEEDEEKVMSIEDLFDEAYIEDIDKGISSDLEDDL